MRNLDELIDEYRDLNNITRNEGETGVQNLCRLVRALGYKDPQYFGQFHPNGSYGDLIEFLQDNSGCVEAIVNWIGKQNVPDWKAALEEVLPPDTDADEDEGKCLTCKRNLTADDDDPEFCNECRQGKP